MAGRQFARASRSAADVHVSLVSRGATAILIFRWRQPRFGTEKFHGAILPHHLEGSGRVYQEISQIGKELTVLAPALQGTKIVSEACILYSHDNDWTLQQPNQAQ
ncbi:MAG: beta-galactosidase [Limisphaerales bacterium]